MKQFTLFTEDLDEFLEFAGRLRGTPVYQNARDRLLLIFSQEGGDRRMHARVLAVKRLLPEAKMVGLTMSSFRLSHNKEPLGGAVYTFLLFEDSCVDLLHYSCEEMSAAEAGEQLRRELSGAAHVAGVLVFTAGIVMEVDRFLNAVSRDLNVPILGAEAAADGTPFVFGDFGGDSRGVAALVFRGERLHLHYNYDMGWKPIGKDMRITAMDGSYCVSEIDGKPALSIYQRYLGVLPDKYFAENVREFPLIADRGRRKIVRCPARCDADGKLYFIAKLNEGETVRLSYANPRRLLEDTKLYAGAMKAFEPQALLLIVCENRARFLGELTTNDFISYTSYAPQTAWTRGFAGIMLDRHGGGVVNSAILSLGLREGRASGSREAPSPVVLPGRRATGAIPLNERLARFLEQTTNELEDMAVAADAANSAKSAFLSNMSHEIRTPINAILGMNEMILRESREDDVLSYARNIRTAGLSLLGIISDILDFSKIEAGRMDILPEDYEVPSLVSDLVNLVWLRAEEKGLRLDVSVDPAIPHLLYGDVMRIKQVITNLLTNAVKYTEQGAVTLTIGYEKRSEDEIALNVAVEDTGYGIREEDLGRLFNAFDRIDKERERKIEGTGLGLNITQQLLTLMGSTLHAESVFGQGSRFHFSLRQKVVEWEEIGDRSAAPHGERRKKNRSVKRFAAPNARVLVVDDAPMNLAVVSGLLKRTRISVETVGSGAECLHCFAARDYDMVFLDHRMPNMDGVETLAALRERFPDKVARTPIISLTANAVAGAREQYLAAGFTDYLTKPVMSDELEKMIAKYLPPEKLQFDLSSEAAEEAAATLPEFLADIDALDTGKGMAYCGGISAYVEALTIFAESIPAKSAEIEKCCAEGDIAGYTIRVHALKSMARSVGAEELSGLAARLEAAGDRGDTDTVYSQTGKLIVMYRRLGKPLQPLLLSRGAPERAEKPELGVPELLDAAETLRELSAAFDYDSVRMVADELSGRRPPAPYAEAFRALLSAVDRVDWDGMAAALDTIKTLEEKA